MENSQNPKLGPASDFVTTDPKKCVKIFSTNKDDEFLTIPEVFARTVDRYPNRTALMQKDEAGVWISVTYLEYKNRIEHVAKAFMSLGLERKGRVAILAFNSIEWFICAMAAVHAGGQFIGIYNTNSAEACYYILKKCRANVIVVDDDVQLEKVMKFRNKLPHLKIVVQTFSTEKNYKNVLKWKELEEIDVSNYDMIYQKNLMEITANSCAAILFTSGTTGLPKGAMLSHDNCTLAGKLVSECLGISQSPPEIFLSYLPLSHIAALTGDFFVSTNIGGIVCFASKNAFKGELINSLNEARPTFFPSVPRVWEKIYEKLFPEIQNLGAIKKFLVTWAQDTALKYNLELMRNSTSSFSMSYVLAKYLILNKLKKKMGLDRVKYIPCGSAPLNTDIIKFFLSLDINFIDCYGMTEVGIMTANKIYDARLGSVGKPLRGIETKILNPDTLGVGEVLIRGRTNFMGYLDDIDKTREILDADHWIHSGDLGYMDDDGFLYITGRTKELIITAGGENIPYLLIEGSVKSESSAISNAVLIGDRRKFLSILITLKTKVDGNGAPTDELADETIEVIKSLGLNCRLMSEVIKSGPDVKILNYLQEVINRANKKAISSAQKVQKIVILPNDFSIATGELGPTMKLKRNFIIEKYKKEIDHLYA